jgi:transposase-like protein
MTKHRSHSAAFKRQVAEEFIAGEALHALSKRHDISRQLIRIWVGKFEAGALDDDVQAADLIQDYEAKIAALERMVGRQALEIELLEHVHPDWNRSHAKKGVPKRPLSTIRRPPVSMHRRPRWFGDVANPIRRTFGTVFSRRRTMVNRSAGSRPCCA